MANLPAPTAAITSLRAVPATVRTASAAPIAVPESDRIEPRRLLAFTAMVFGMFMAILDIQIVSASLTEIQAGLAASADEIPWVQTAYLIAEVVMIPLSGYLSRALGTRLVFAISAGGFTVASLLCGTASSIDEERPQARLASVKPPAERENRMRVPMARDRRPDSGIITTSATR